MAVTIKALFELSLQLTELWGTGPRGIVARHNVLGPEQSLVIRRGHGTSAGNANLLYFRAPALAAGANSDFDLAGSLTDSEGTVITMAKWQLIVVFNFNTAGSITFRQAAANGLSTGFTGASGGAIAGAARNAEEPGIGLLFHPNGSTVTAGTGDKINVLNNDGVNAANFYLGLMGTTV